MLRNWINEIVKRRVLWIGMVIIILVGPIGWLISRNPTKETEAADVCDTFYVTADSMVGVGNPDTNYGSYTYMDSAWSDYYGFSNVRSLLKFSITDRSANYDLVSAELHVGSFGQSASQDVKAYRITGSWTESGVTWNNKPDYTSDGASPTVTVWGVAWYTFDVNGIVSAWINGSSNYGIYLMSLSSSDSGYAHFYTKEYNGGSDKPYLVVCWNLKPTPTPTMAPDTSVYFEGVKMEGIKVE